MIEPLRRKLNGDGIMKPDATVVDFEWYGKGLHDGGDAEMKVRNNIIPELAAEWGMDGADAPDNAGEVERNIPDSDQVVFFARDLMNRGEPMRRVVPALRERFAPETIRFARTPLEAQMRLDGLAGRVALDARGYSSCRAAMDAAGRSPYRRTLAGVVGCSCKERKQVMAGGIGSDVVEDSTGNGFDDFLGSYGGETEHPTVETCPMTMLPVLDGCLGLVSAEKAMAAAVSMGLPRREAARIASSDRTNVGKTMAAFRALDGISGRRIEVPVDQASHVVKRAEAPVEFEVEFEEMEVEQALGASFDLDPERKPEEKLSVTADIADLEFDLTDTNDMDVEMGGATLAGFEGHDEFELDPERSAVELLDVDHRGGLEW